MRCSSGLVVPIRPVYRLSRSFFLWLARTGSCLSYQFGKHYNGDWSLSDTSEERSRPIGSL